MSVFSLTRLASVLATAGLCLLGVTSQAEQSSSSSGTAAQSSDRQSISSQSSDGTVRIYDRSLISSSEESRLNTTVTLPAGITAKEGARESAVLEAVRDVLATATDAAISGDMKKLVEQLSGPDRQRLEDVAAGDESLYRASLDRFNSSWQTVYKAGWKMVDREEVFGPRFMAIQVGEISDASQLSSWPVAPTMSRGQSSTTQERVADNYFSKGRDVALVVLPAAGNAPELTVSMIHEAPDFWKIDIPDSITVDQLRTNLTQHLDRAAASSNQWPNDNYEANRMMARHVLMSLYGVQGISGTTGSTSTTPAGTRDTNRGASSGTSSGTSGTSSGTSGTSGSVGINTPIGGVGGSAGVGSSGASGGVGVNTPAGGAGASGSAGSSGASGSADTR